MAMKIFIGLLSPPCFESSSILLEPFFYLSVADRSDAAGDVMSFACNSKNSSIRRQQFGVDQMDLLTTTYARLRGMSRNRREDLAVGTIFLQADSIRGQSPAKPVPGHPCSCAAAIVLLDE